jgi:hypothetical protein
VRIAKAGPGTVNDDNFEAIDTHSNLCKASTKQITVVGQARGNYTAPLVATPYVDLMPTVFSTVPTQPLFYSETMTITLGAAVTNRGNTVSVIQEGCAPGVVATTTSPSGS